ALDPTHARSFQALPDDFAARLRGTAAAVPTLLPVGRVLGVMAVVRKTADQLAQRLLSFVRHPGWHFEPLQGGQQRFAPLLVEKSLGPGWVEIRCGLPAARLGILPSVARRASWTDDAEHPPALPDADLQPAAGPAAGVVLHVPAARACVG